MRLSHTRFFRFSLTPLRGGLALGAGLLTALEARGQWEVGGCIGPNLATHRYQQQGQRVKEKKVLLLHLGLTSSFPLGPNIALQPELLISQVGTKHARPHENTRHTHGTHTDFLQYLTLPVAMVGRIPLRRPANSHLAIGGGPYAAVLTFAERTRKGETFADDLNVGDEPRADYRRFDAGMSMRAIFEYKRIFTGFTFTYGMMNIQAYGDEQTGRYTRSLSLTWGVRGHWSVKKPAPASQ